MQASALFRQPASYSILFPTKSLLLPECTLVVLMRQQRLDDNTGAGIRDRALLLVGFAGALRRSELVALNVEDIAFVPEGSTITIRRSKTDQTGEGRKIGIPSGKNKHTCPVRSLKAWLTEGGIKVGSIFRGIDRHGGTFNPAALPLRAWLLWLREPPPQVGWMNLCSVVIVYGRGWHSHPLQQVSRKEQ